MCAVFIALPEACLADSIRSIDVVKLVSDACSIGNSSQPLTNPNCVCREIQHDGNAQGEEFTNVFSDNLTQSP